MELTKEELVILSEALRERWVNNDDISAFDLWFKVKQEIKKRKGEKNA